MDILRIGVFQNPCPLLCVEFVSDQKLFVWAIQVKFGIISIDDMLTQMKVRFPSYLGRIRDSQLYRMLEFASQGRPRARRVLTSESKVNTVNYWPKGVFAETTADSVSSFKTENIMLFDSNFVYDLQVDFPTARGPPFDDEPELNCVE
jgi:hypothetical protein